MNLYLTDEEMLKLDQQHYIEIGRQEAKQEMILALYQNGVSPGLPIKDIKKIIKCEQSN